MRDGVIPYAMKDIFEKRDLLQQEGNNYNKIIIIILYYNIPVYLLYNNINITDYNN